MQDEIIKHSKKIYKTLKGSEHGFWSKVKEIFIEIFIIVFAVSLSIWFHSWSEHNHEQKEATEFLHDLQDDIKKDISGMKEKRDALQSILKSCERIIHATNKKDTLNDISLHFSLSTFKANDGNYQGFKSSGKVGYIEDKALKRMILSYYEKDLPALYEVDKYQYAKQLEVWEMINSLQDRNPFANPLLKAKILTDAQITEALITAYTDAIENATSIVAAIQKDSE